MSTILNGNGISQRGAAPDFNAWRVGLGQAVVLVGAPLAWIGRDVLHGGRSPVYSALVLLAGILLSTNFSHLRRGKLRADLTQLGIVLAPIMIMTALAVAPFANGGISPMNTRQMIDNTVLMLLILAGYSQPLSEFRYIHRVTAILGCFVATVSLLYAISSVGNLADFVLNGRFGGFGEDAQSSTVSAPNTIAKIGLITIVAAWIWYKESDELRPLAATIVVAAAASAVPMFVLARSRTNMVSAIMALLIAIMLSGLRRRIYGGGITVRRRPRMTRLKLAFVCVLGTILMAGSSFLLEKFLPLVRAAWEFLGRGASAVFAGGVDASASTRGSYLAHALDTFSLWGHGFNAAFIDNPVAEAFYDLGLIGGLGYLLVVVLIPLKICLDIVVKSHVPAFIKFSVVCYFVQMPFLFLSTTPYMLNNWTFVVIFYAIAGRYWCNRNQPVANFSEPRA